MATKTFIADLFPDREGMVLVAKDVRHQSAKSYRRVANGGNCGCVPLGLHAMAQPYCAWRLPR